MKPSTLVAFLWVSFVASAAQATGAITYDAQQLRFTLQGKSMAYVLRVVDGELVHEYWGAPVGEGWQPNNPVKPRGWRPLLSATQREFPDVGRGDLRAPAVRMINGAGVPLVAFRYVSYEITAGKPEIPGLPSTTGDDKSAETLTIVLRDTVSGVDAELVYTVFPSLNVVTRHAEFINRGDKPVTIARAASFSVDFPPQPYEMVQLSGDWARERQEVRRRVFPGIQAVQSQAGFSGHEHNPFVALLSEGATETSGEVFGFNLVYSGSFAASVEQNPQGLVRVMIGLNPSHATWTLKPKQTFATPECVGVYSAHGLGDMSRTFHDLYRTHLTRSPWQNRPRPVLLNNWEATHFTFDANDIVRMAGDAQRIGVKLMVLDDGWFGRKHPRDGETAGLGDWVANPAKLPEGLDGLAKRINALGLKFGVWVEPEMVNAESELFAAHPDWVLQAAGFAQTEQRHQRVLDLSQKAVQDYLIARLSDLLSSAPIAYVKWDLNRAMHEIPTPATPHAYMLGLYRVVDAVTARFSNVLFEGCASGGGRFDPGMLYYMPQSWTSDNTDGADRLRIQFGSSMAYPMSSMGGHVSAVPNHQTGRVTKLSFRAHVAMMCGAFGFELDLAKLTDEERAQLPALVAQYESIQPLVQQGDFYRIAKPTESNWPVAAFVSKDKSRAVAMAFQMQHIVNEQPPPLRFQGLDPAAVYKVVGGNNPWRGDTLMDLGLPQGFFGDYDSHIIVLERL